MNLHNNDISNEKVIFCKKCVQSNQRPNTSPEFKKSNKIIGKLSFDDNGICHPCKYYEKVKSKINWADREKELKDLCEKYRDKNKEYDVLVPGSGGKDSIYVSHLLKTKYNMKPLTITWAPHMYTDVGLKNLFEWQKLGFDHLLVTPNYQTHSLLTKLAFKKLLNPFQPFIIGQKNHAPKIALKYGIELIMYGENNAEVHNNISETQTPLMDPKHYSSESENDKIFLGGCEIDQFHEYKLKKKDLSIYIPYERSVYEEKNIKVHFMSYYKKWSPHENYYYVKNICNFNFNPDGRSEGTYTKFASLDDKTDGQNYFTMLIKFGHGRATNDACRDIRDGFITREEAVRLVNKYDDEFPKKYFHDFLDYIKISENEYWETIDQARSTNLWRQDGNKWILKNKVV